VIRAGGGGGEIPRAIKKCDHMIHPHPAFSSHNPVKISDSQRPGGV
jgi:hypothetical protein